jgi:Fe-S-cluster-containing dehydrogenase component
VGHTCKAGKGIESVRIMEEKKGNRHRYGMVIDLDRCTGCGTCVVACASENNVVVRADESDKERSIAWMQLYKINNGEKFPRT